MRAWYDIRELDIPRLEDAAGVRESEQLLLELIRREQERGIPAERIVLAGFSRGVAMALHKGLRYPQRLAGILALSCHLPLAETLAVERHPANQAVPLFLAYGSYDPVVPWHYSEATARQLTEQGYPVEPHEYPMGHEVNGDEIMDISHWLRQVLPVPEPGS